MCFERLICILEIFGQKGEAIIADICAHSDLPKPSAYRLVKDLVNVGLLEPVVRGRFTIGIRLKQIRITRNPTARCWNSLRPL